MTIEESSGEHRWYESLVGFILHLSEDSLAVLVAEQKNR